MNKQFGYFSTDSWLCIGTKLKEILPLCDRLKWFNLRESPYVIRKGFLHPIIFKYLYTVGLLSPHTLASSDTFSVPAINAG